MDRPPIDVPIDPELGKMFVETMRKRGDKGDSSAPKPRRLVAHLKTRTNTPKRKMVKITPELIKKGIELYKTGMRIHHIACELSVSDGSIRYHIRKHERGE